MNLDTTRDEPLRLSWPRKLDTSVEFGVMELAATVPGFKTGNLSCLYRLWPCFWESFSKNKLYTFYKIRPEFTLWTPFLRICLRFHELHQIIWTIHHLYPSHYKWDLNSVESLETTSPRNIGFQPTWLCPNKSIKKPANMFKYHEHPWTSTNKL